MREKGRRRDIEREGEIRERERERERCKGYRERVKGRGIEHSCTENLWERNKAQRKVDYKN